VYEYDIPCHLSDMPQQGPNRNWRLQMENSGLRPMLATSAIEGTHMQLNFEKLYAPISVLRFDDLIIYRSLAHVQIILKST
jgi:hypothetical protein